MLKFSCWIKDTLILKNLGLLENFNSGWQFSNPLAKWKMLDYKLWSISTMTLPVSKILFFCVDSLPWLALLVSDAEF